MTHKQIKFGKGKSSRKVKPEVKPVEEEYESVGAYQRAVLMSSCHVDRLAEESSRATLFNRFVNSPEDHYDTRECASYYRAPNGYIEAPYSITSQADAVYIPKALRVIPTYPSLIQAPQWCPPYVRQALQQHSHEDLMMNRKYNCRCLECKSQDCPARDISQSRPRRVRDNIMTFSDQSTMTRNVYDAGCGCTPTPSTSNCTAVSLPRDMSRVCDRDLQGKVKFRTVNQTHDDYTPAPILKKGSNTDPEYTNYWSQSQDEYDEYKPPNSKSVKRWFIEDEKRKNIYNEGISDVAFEFPSYRWGAKSRPCSPRSPKSVTSRAMSGALSDRCSDTKVDIPYSHRTESRYHKHCVDVPMQITVQNKFRATSKPRLPVFIPTIPARSRTPSPRPMTPSQGKTPCCSGQQNKPKRRTIKLPKKMLTSEKVIPPQMCKVPCGKR